MSSGRDQARRRTAPTWGQLAPRPLNLLSYGISRDILERLVRVTRSRDIFNTRSLMMFRWISSVPPAIEVAGPPRPFL